MHMLHSPKDKLVYVQDNVMYSEYSAVFRIRIRIRIRIHRIHMFLDLLDPDPDPLVRGLDPGSGSGSFYHHAKIVRKTLIPTILWLFLTF
jgi:hypothetical protein